jgi:hypothetical protein
VKVMSSEFDDLFVALNTSLTALQTLVIEGSMSSAGGNWRSIRTIVSASGTTFSLNINKYLTLRFSLTGGGTTILSFKANNVPNAQLAKLVNQLNGYSGWGQQINLSSGTPYTTSQATLYTTIPTGWMSNYLYVQIPAIPAGRTLQIEVSMTSGSGNFRTIAILDSTHTIAFNEFACGAFSQVQFTYSGGGTFSISYWASVYSKTGDATAANQTSLYDAIFKSGFSTFFDSSGQSVFKSGDSNVSIYHLLSQLLTQASAITKPDSSGAIDVRTGSDYDFATILSNYKTDIISIAAAGGRFIDKGIIFNQALSVYNYYIVYNTI